MKANPKNQRGKTRCKQSPARQGAQGSSTRGRPRRLKVLNLTFNVLFLSESQMAHPVHGLVVGASTGRKPRPMPL